MKNRQGSYKKVLIEESLLKGQSGYLKKAIEDLKALRTSDFSFTTLYILLFLRIRHSTNWLQQKSRGHHGGELLLDFIPESFLLTEWEKEKLKGMSAIDLFSNCGLKGIPQSINRAMINWYHGEWNIIVLEHIPSSYELLTMQIKNARCITLITDKEKIDSLVLKSRDPLSFVLHDLMHADQFWGQKEALRGQLGFYQLVHKIYKRPLLAGELKSNKEFKKDFEYVVSDMNAYSIHLFKCLKSTFSKSSIFEEIWNDLLSAWQMSELERQSSMKLNTHEFSLDDEIVLKDFFEKHYEVTA